MNKNMLRNEEQLKRELPFDLYGRYGIIRDIINANRKPDQRFRVLDVGGRGNLMKKFLPSDDVFYLDPLIDSKDENFLKGDGCAMPLDGNSYDWVTSADVFEHIPEEKREFFLKENIRVAKLGVILSAPFWSREVEQAEINANENHKKFNAGVENIWLKEHIENKLPKENETEEFLKINNLNFQKLYNNRLFLWEMLIGINFFIGSNFSEDIKKELEEFNYFYNIKVFPHDSMDPSYRKIYFIKKDDTLKNIEIKNKPMDDVLFLDTMKKSMDLIGTVDTENKKIIQQQNQVIEQGNQEIKQKNVLIQQQKQKIDFIKSSKFWKLREKYINFKNKLKV